MHSNAVAIKSLVTVYQSADAAFQADEVLFGMPLTVLGEGEGGLLPVRTMWQLEGFVRAGDILWQEQAAREWKAYGKMAARAPFADVMERPAVDSRRIACLPRGGLVHPLGPQQRDGWLPVGLPGGARGYAKGGNLMWQVESFANQNEKLLREALATSALSYLGVQYRWAGRSPFGMDSAGLVSMAYHLNGAVVPRSRQFVPGGDIRPIGRERLAMGDVLYFKGHMGMYLGEGQYIHASSKHASDAVVINSLAPSSPFYLPELDRGLVCCASLFGGD